MNTTPMTLSDVAALLRLTLTDPAAAARAVLSAGFPREHHWSLFLLTITLTGALWQLSVIVSPPQLPEGATPPSGFTVTALTGASILLLAMTIRWVGRLAGGEGDLESVLLLTIWYGLVQVPLGVVELVVLLIAPGLGAVFVIAVIAVMLWVLTNFIAVVHGFHSLGRVFLGMALTVAALAFILSIVIAPFLAVPTGA